MAAVATASPLSQQPSLLYANISSVEKSYQQDKLYNNLHSLINGMYTGSLKCVAKFYPDILRWLRELKVEIVDDGTEAAGQTTNTNQISDLQLSMLILAGSKEHGSPHLHVRKKFLADLLTELRKHNLPVGIESINAFIRASLDNACDVNAARFLETILKNGVNPNFQTLELLSAVYARNANPKAILELMTILSEEEGNNLSTTLFQNLAIAEVNLCIAKQNESNSSAYDSMESLHRVVELLKKKCGPFEGRSTYTRPILVYLYGALAFAQAGRIDEAVLVLDYLAKTYYDNVPQNLHRQWNRQILEIYLYLLGSKNCDCKTVFEKMRPFLLLTRGKHNNVVVAKPNYYLAVVHLSKLKSDGNEEAIFHIHKLFDSRFRI